MVGWRFVILAWKARAIELKFVYLFSVLAILLRILEFVLIIYTTAEDNKTNKLIITMITLGKVSTMLTSGVGMAMACFFLDLYVAIRTITAIAKNRPVRRMQSWVKCIKITFTVTTLTAFITLLGINLFSPNITLKSPKFELGLFVIYTYGWIFVLTSVCLLVRQMSTVFLGDEFSREKCKIYTMFFMLSLSYFAFAVINGLLLSYPITLKNY